MSKSKFKGTGVALVTPFKKGRVDFDALPRVVEHTIAGGVDFLVPLGSTGEAATLAAEEKREVIQCIVKANRARLPIVSGFAGSDTKEMVRILDQMDLSGVDGLLISSPAYNKPNQTGIRSHYATLAHISPLPIILYNVPGRTGSNVLPETVLALATEHDNIVAVKEASGDINQCMKIASAKPESFALLSGDDPITLPMIASGGDGVISVIANAFPRIFSSMVGHALNDDMDRARKAHYEVYDIHSLLYVDGNPSGIKTVMEILGLCGHEVRLPLAPMTAANRKKLEQAIAHLVPNLV